MFGQAEGTESWNHGGHRAKEPFFLPSPNLNSLSSPVVKSSFVCLFVFVLFDFLFCVFFCFLTCIIKAFF